MNRHMAYLRVVKRTVRALVHGDIVGARELVLKMLRRLHLDVQCHYTHLSFQSVHVLELVGEAGDDAHHKRID